MRRARFFLTQLERAFGREEFDAFLKGYFDRFAFHSIGTAEFLTALRDELLADNESLAKTIPVNEWVFQPGLPANVPAPRATAFFAVDAAATDWVEGGHPAASGWSTQEWMRFLKALPERMTQEQMARLDTEFGFTNSTNNEILAAWLLMSIHNDYRAARPRLDQFLTSVGRRVYVRPLYAALPAEEAREIFARARDSYHHITRASIDALLAPQALAR